METNNFNNWREHKGAIDPTIQGGQVVEDLAARQFSEVSPELLQAATGTMRGAGGPGNPGPGGPGQHVLKDVVAPSHRNSRPLAQSKRAEQNRQAQKAFRARKELYIKELEAQARQLKKTEETISSLKKENEELRDYILALQSKLVDVPTPPSVLTPMNAKRMAPPAISSGSSSLQKEDDVFDSQLKGK